MQGLLKNVCTGKVASTVGTGIGSSRSLIHGIVANGPKSLFSLEKPGRLWRVQFIHPDALSQCTRGYTASQSTASVGTLPPPWLLSSRGRSCTWILLTLGSLWLVGICFMLARLWSAWSSTKLSSKSSVPAWSTLPASTRLVCLGWISQL